MANIDGRSTRSSDVHNEEDNQHEQEMELFQKVAACIGDSLEAVCNMQEEERRQLIEVLGLKNSNDTKDENASLNEEDEDYALDDEDAALDNEDAVLDDADAALDDVDVALDDKDENSSSVDKDKGAINEKKDGIRKRCRSKSFDSEGNKRKKTHTVDKGIPNEQDSDSGPPDKVEYGKEVDEHDIKINANPLISSQHRVSIDNIAELDEQGESSPLIWKNNTNASTSMNKEVVDPLPGEEDSVNPEVNESIVKFRNFTSTLVSSLDKNKSLTPLHSPNALLKLLNSSSISPLPRDHPHITSNQLREMVVTSNNNLVQDLTKFMSSLEMVKSKGVVRTSADGDDEKWIQLCSSTKSKRSKVATSRTNARATRSSNVERSNNKNYIDDSTDEEFFDASNKTVDSFRSTTENQSKDEDKLKKDKVVKKFKIRRRNVSLDNGEIAVSTVENNVNVPSRKSSITINDNIALRRSSTSSNDTVTSRGASTSVKEPELVKSEMVVINRNVESTKQESSDTDDDVTIVAEISSPQVKNDTHEKEGRNQESPQDSNISSNSLVEGTCPMCNVRMEMRALEVHSEMCEGPRTLRGKGDETELYHNESIRVTKRKTPEPKLVSNKLNRGGIGRPRPSLFNRSVGRESPSSSSANKEGTGLHSNEAALGSIRNRRSPAISSQSLPGGENESEDLLKLYGNERTEATPVSAEERRSNPSEDGDMTDQLRDIQLKSPKSSRMTDDHGSLVAPANVRMKRPLKEGAPWASFLDSVNDGDN